jgi:hypothetical protein
MADIKDFEALGRRHPEIAELQRRGARVVHRHRGGKLQYYYYY